jgi:HD-GYP domain-containing protein (c-di-GMP phosphodiesterase class II)
MDIPASISRQCEDLAQLLGTECLPHLLTESGIFPKPDDTEFAVSAALIHQSRRSAEENVYPVASERILFSIPLFPALPKEWFAVGILHESNLDVAQKLVHLANLALQRQNQVVSQDAALIRAEDELGKCFTERQWLRQLNSQRAVRKRSVGQQCKQSLESLRVLLGAEAIAIFLYQDVNLENHGLEPMITGRSIWCMDDIRILMQRIQKPQSSDSTVLNQVAYQLQSGVMHSCVVVPIGESEPIGYVVAMNHRKANAAMAHSLYSGFQSGDAELLHELASYLVSDGYSNLMLQESEQLVLGTLRAMSNAIEARDPYTHGHSERVAHVAYEIAVRLQLSEVACQEIYLAGILHDIGKIGIPDQVLLKPGKLDPEELSVIQRHPEIGHRILEELGKLKFALPGVLYHHERIDGTGYPHRLKGDSIPLMARILAVSDAYDAMTSSRVYRNAMGHDRAIEILRNGAGSQWNVQAVAACLEYIAERELVLPDGSSEHRPRTKVDDWRQVSQALRVLQL